MHLRRGHLARARLHVVRVHTRPLRMPPGPEAWRPARHDSLGGWQCQQAVRQPRRDRLIMYAAGRVTAVDPAQAVATRQRVSHHE